MTNPFADLSDLLSLIHSGDWRKAGVAAHQIGESTIPADPQELAEYRRRLHHTLISARAARANLAAELTRVQVARQFSGTYQNGTDVPERSSIRTSGGHLI